MIQYTKILTFSTIQEAKMISEYLQDQELLQDTKVQQQDASVLLVSRPELCDLVLGLNAGFEQISKSDEEKENGLRRVIRDNYSGHALDFALGYSLGAKCPYGVTLKK